jgi:ribokinase
LKIDCIGFGALNLDRLYLVEHIAKGGEESFIRYYKEYAGGSAANAIVGLARLGHKVGYIGKISEDKDGEFILRSLISEGVDTRGLIVSKDGSSGFVVGFVDGEGERALYVAPGVNDTLDFDDISLDYVYCAKMLHLSSFVGELPFNAQKMLIEVVQDIDISLDPGNIYAKRGIVAIRPILKHCLVVFPNEAEIWLLTGYGPEEGAELLLKEGANIVAVKLGRRGCYVTNGKERHWVKAYPVEVVDTTGAGDAFCAGFLHGLITGKDLYECGRLGNLVAAKKLRKFGPRDGLPFLQDLGL